MPRYKKVKGRKPSGQLWDAYLAILAIYSTVARIDVLPPGAPEAAVLALRDAVRGMSDDRQFAEEAMKSIGYVPEYATSPDFIRHVRSSLELGPETKAFISNYIDLGKR